MDHSKALQFAKRYANTLPLIVAGAAALLIVYILVAMFRLFFASPQGVDQIPAENINAAVIRDWQREIPRWQLFGIPPLDEKIVPETRSRLQLHGIFYATDPQQSQAIIAVEGDQAKVYHPGDVVDGSIKVHEIKSDEVILNRDGLLEKLVLPKKGLEFAPDPEGLLLSD